MPAISSRIRRALSFENVLVTVIAFMVLTGGAAYAANQLGKNSVGTKQLKKNSVTAKKIKKNAVTTAKIKKNAVTGAKVKDGSIGGGKIELESTPFSHIVHEARGSATVPVVSGADLVLYPLDNPAYTQPPGRDDSFFGALDVSFDAGCGPDREAEALLMLDPANAADPDETEVVAFGEVEEEEATGAATQRMNISIYPGGRRNPSGSPINHNLVLGVGGDCEVGSGITFSNGAVDVVGTR